MTAHRLITPLRVLKTALSVFLIYHLFAVSILPMGNGLIIRELGRYFYQYANLFGFNATWRFFASGTTPSFNLEYTFTYPATGTEEDRESEPKLFPEKRSESVGSSDYYIRRLASVQFFAISEVNTEEYLIPWLCRRDAKADGVIIRRLLADVQPIERYRIDQSAENFSQMLEPIQSESHSYTCVGRRWQ